ncbi:MAG: universal stress protein [Caldimonas sp.]
MSPIKSILVHFDLSAASKERLRVASRIAAVHEAHVTALYAVSSIYAVYPFAIVSSPEAAAVLLGVEESRAIGARAAFAEASRGLSPLPTWAETTFLPERAVASQARYADLLVLGQPEPGAATDVGLPGDFAASVLIDSGRPALVIPYVGAPEVIGDVAVVAWKNTPEAARALGAALPLLQRCKRVHVVTWVEDGDAEPAGPLDIETSLRRHGIDATLHRHSAAPESVGEMLLSFVTDVSADLLVMGCYGHGRMREWVLGGATRVVLASMTVPVLMSH